MDTLQKSILEIYLEIKKICDENKIEYYAIGGTCIGAVRHSGFIPWDDDLDIAMPREDYEKFKSIAKKKLPPNFQIIDEKSSNNTNVLFSKVHNISTTCIEESVKGNPNFYTGVWVDIMPLDGLPEKNFFIKMHLLKLKFFYILDICQKNVVQPKNYIKEYIAKPIIPFLQKFPQNYFRKKYFKIVTSYSFEESQYTSFAWSLRANKLIFKKKYFEDKILFEFEHTEIPCPIGYKEVLNQMFGNYMVLPDVKDRQTHNIIVFDKNLPLLEYIKQKGEKND